MSFKIPEGDKKAVYVQSRFNRIAGKYDLFNDIVTQGMHRYWKRFMVNRAKLRPGDSVLDICCGTGDIVQLLQKRVGKEGVAIGLDFSRGMLSVASARNRSGTTLFIQGDAAVIPVKTESIDAITVGYGLRNLKEITPCLKEVHRVLKPGGRFLSLDMGKVSNPFIRTFFNFYFFRIVPRIGRLLYPGEDLFDYFPESSVAFPSQEKLAEMLSDCGFSNISFTGFYFGGVVVHYAEKP